MALKILDDLSFRLNRYRTKVDEFLSRALGINDSSQARLFKTILDVMSDQMQLSFLYQSQSHKELAPQTAQKTTSIRGLAELSGHSATRPISARGTVKLTKIDSFSVGSFLYVSPSATLKCSTNNLIYKVDIDTERRYSLNNNTIELPLIQGELRNQTFVVDAISENTQLYTIRLDDTEFIENYSVKVIVNNETWSKADSLLDMASGDKEYLLRNGWGSQLDIIFGDETHGVELSHGDRVEVHYLITQGELGIISQSDEFTILAGFTDLNNDELTEFTIKRANGFLLASNGENTEVTRNLIGYSSRALTFASPQNLKAYLSRLSILSHIDVWSDKNNDLISYVLALPKLYFLNSRDYLAISEDKLKLSEEQKTDIKSLINNSRRQFPSSEIVMVDPLLKRYSIIVYIEGDIDDTETIKNLIKDTISEHFLRATYKSSDFKFENKIINSKIESEIQAIDDVKSVQLSIFSEDNENAKSVGTYTLKEVVVQGTSRIVTDVTKTVESGENPNLGLGELNDIVVNNGEVPVLRPISLYQNNTLTALTDSVLVFHKQNNTWKQL